MEASTPLRGGALHLRCRLGRRQQLAHGPGLPGHAGRHGRSHADAPGRHDEDATPEADPAYERLLEEVGEPESGAGAALLELQLLLDALDYPHEASHESRSRTEADVDCGFSGGLSLLPGAITSILREEEIQGHVRKRGSKFS